MTADSTTAVLQTPPGRGGIAVISLRGDGAADVAGKVFRPFASHSDSDDGVLQLGHLVVDGEVIDEVIVCRTGREVEINIHGGTAVARKTLEQLARFGATVTPPAPAAEGTFLTAHRKWNNPAIGAEMLDALPLARSGPATLAVAGQWSGGLSALARSENPSADVLRGAAGRYPQMQRLLNPAEVVLVGATNVGKSTLANALVGRPVSIVHATPGTTRDWVRELAVFHGVPIWLTDTAGLWDAPPGVDAQAVRRGRRRAEDADLVLLLATHAEAAVPAWLGAKGVLRVWAKCDVHRPNDWADVAVSARNGEGLEQLRQAVVAALGLADFDVTRPAAFTPRQRDLLTQAADAIDQDDRDRTAGLLRTLLEG